MRNLIVSLFLINCLGLDAQEINAHGVTICWDTSLSMSERDLDKDLSVLESYFKKTDKVEVQLLYFNFGVQEKSFIVNNGNWSELENDLRNIAYDGASIFSNLNDKIRYPEKVFVFTDGNQLLTKDAVSLPDKSFIVNSSTNRNEKFLERTALVNKARLVDFATTTDEVLKSKSADIKADEAKGLLKGTVYIDNKPAAKAKVAIKNNSDSFLTNSAGNFSIPAEVGDTLLVTSLESKTMKIVPIELLSNTKIFLEANIVALDEVVVAEKRQQEETEMVSTGFASYDKNRVGYSVSTVEADEISAIATVADDALRNKVAGVKIDNNGYTGVEGGLAKTNIRGQSSLNMDQNALIVINGVPTQSNNGIKIHERLIGDSSGNFNYIDPANIEKITVLKGLAATNQWGSEGANGVILITTKTAGAGNTKSSGKIVDRARLKNNIYDEADTGISPNSAFYNSLTSLKTPKEAYETYLSLRAMNYGNISFYLDAFSYFKGKDTKLAAKIISNIWENNPDNLELLKLVSLALATLETDESSIKITEEIVRLDPNDVNAHFNQSIALRGQGQLQKALNLLVAMDKGNLNSSLDGSTISKTLDREIKDLVNRHKNELNTAQLEPKHLNNLRYKVRLVFEWNLPGAEFELQFVNPNKRFFNWKHTNLEMKERIQNEISKNYRMEEFEFYGSDVSGKWIINATALEDFSQDPNGPFVLKTTIYKDFGSASQTKEEVLIHLGRLHEKKNVRTLLVD